MTGSFSNQPESLPDNPVPVEELLLSLRRKEGNWMQWGQWCQQLQKAGLSPQAIFEGTGFEPIQQNQIIVAEQVYGSIEASIGEATRSRFERTGSDILYELRILKQDDRAAAAGLIVEKGIDSDGAKDVARALKDARLLSKPPQEFPDYPADAVAYYYWKLARQQGDLQVRSRLIAQALRFASSDSARREVERLLTDFTVSRQTPAPRLPFYRLESASEVPKVLPVAGKLPLTAADLAAVPMVEEEGPFGMVKFSGMGAWVPVPGWQVILAAEDPVVVLVDSDQLPGESSSTTEEVMVVVDRAQREWDATHYFLVDQDVTLAVQWFEEPPPTLLLGEVVLVMRPRRVLDEEYNKDLWQLDE